MTSDVSRANHDIDAEQELRAAACRALGIDPATVAWPDVPGETRAGRAVQADEISTGLDDEEWALISTFLPAEAPQASAMTNRTFLDAVLAAMQRGGAWTSRATPTSEIEAVRRRFGRWAHQGIFQGLRETLPKLALAPEHARLLDLAGQRAASLKARRQGRGEVRR